MKLFGKEGCTNLMHGDGARQGGKYQQGIEQDADDIAHGRQRTESLLEDVWQRDEDERRATVGTDAHGGGGGEDNQPGEYGDEGVKQCYLAGGIQQASLL